MFSAPAWSGSARSPGMGERGRRRLLGASILLPALGPGRGQYWKCRWPAVDARTHARASALWKWLVRARAITRSRPTETVFFSARAQDAFGDDHGSLTNAAVPAFHLEASQESNSDSLARFSGGRVPEGQPRSNRLHGQKNSPGGKVEMVGPVDPRPHDVRAASDWHRGSEGGPRLDVSSREPHPKRKQPMQKSPRSWPPERRTKSMGACRPDRYAVNS